MASDVAISVKDLRARLKPFVAAPSKLKVDELLLAAAARRVITQDEFDATKSAQVALCKRNTPSKEKLVALIWPLERDDKPAEARIKRKRGDVALRIASAKSTQFDVVTSTWKSFSRQAAQLLPIEQALRDQNKMAFEAHELANDHVLRLLRSGMDIPRLDQSFFQTCCSAVCVDVDGLPSINRHMHADLYDSALAWSELRPEGYVPVRAKGMRVFGQTLSQQMATECGNLVITTLYKRFFRYVRDKMDCSGAFAYKLVKKVYDVLLPPADKKKRASKPRRKKTAAASLVDERPLSASEDRVVDDLIALFSLPPSKSNLSSHPEAFMKPLRVFQRAAVDHGQKKFSLLPHTGGFTIKFVKINANTLRQIIINGLLDQDDCKPPSEPAFMAGQRAWWSKFFNIEKVETKNRTFGNEILTDGKSVKIVMVSSKPPIVEHRISCRLSVHPDTAYVTLIISPFNIQDFQDIQGLDPGMRDMFVSTNLQGCVQSCSSAEFYHDAKYTKSTVKIKRWTASDDHIRALVRDMPSKHETDPTERKAYVKYVLRAFDKLKSFYGGMRFRNFKLLRHIHAKKKLRDICKKLTAAAGSATMLAIGDWSANGVCARGKMGPCKKFRQEAKKWATVMDVDEDFTSKTCNCCKLRSLKNMRCHKHKTSKELRRREGRWRARDLFDDWDAPEGRPHISQKIHSMLHCSTNGCSSMTMNRDVNASKNILELAIAVLLGLPRPRAFCRY